MSKWIRFWSCKAFTANNKSTKMFHTSFSLIRFDCITYVSKLHLHSSSCIYSRSFCSHALCNVIQLSCSLNCSYRRTSSMRSWRDVSPRYNCSDFFTAYNWPSSLLRTLNTSPNEPTPRQSITSKHCSKYDSRKFGRYNELVKDNDSLDNELLPVECNVFCRNEMACGAEWFKLRL